MRIKVRLKEFLQCKIMVSPKSLMLLLGIENSYSLALFQYLCITHLIKLGPYEATLTN